MSRENSQGIYFSNVNFAGRGFFKRLDGNSLEHHRFFQSFRVPFSCCSLNERVQRRVIKSRYLHTFRFPVQLCHQLFSASVRETRTTNIPEVTSVICRCSLNASESKRSLQPVVGELDVVQDEIEKCWSNIVVASDSISPDPLLIARIGLWIIFQGILRYGREACFGEINPSLPEQRLSKITRFHLRTI